MEASVWLVLLLALCCSAVSADIPVRLVDGLASSEGRVEIFLNDTWWTVCYSHWSTSNSRVVCRQLGYSSGSETRQNYGFFGNPPSSRPLLLDRFSCSGSESNLGSCTHQPGYISQCPSQYYTGVICQSKVHPPMQVRLMDGRTSLYSIQGRVEVSTNGTWGTICDDKLDNYAAQIICKMLGYNSGNRYLLYGSLYGAGSGPILITRLQCYYTDTNLTTCLQLNSSVFTCPNSQVAGIVCNYTRTTEDIPVRLDGPSPYEGTVELFVYGKWRKLCNGGPDQTLAKAFCRQLGWNLRDDYVASRTSYIVASTPFSNRVSMNSYSCNGQERNIGNCTLYQPLGSLNCMYRYEFGIACYTDQFEATTTTSIPGVDNAETATEKSSGNLPSEGANTGELNVVAVILGATLALSLIVIILILVIFLTRERQRGASYLGDGNRDSQQPAGQRSVREEFYQNAAFHSQAEAAASPASSAPPSTEQDHFYEMLQGREASHK